MSDAKLRVTIGGVADNRTASERQQFSARRARPIA